MGVGNETSLGFNFIADANQMGFNSQPVSGKSIATIYYSSEYFIECGSQYHQYWTRKTFNGVENREN